MFITKSGGGESTTLHMFALIFLISRDGADSYSHSPSSISRANVFPAMGDYLDKHETHLFPLKGRS